MPYAKDWMDRFNASAMIFAKDINGLMKIDREAGGGFKALMNDPQNPTALSNSLLAIDKISLANGNDKDRKAFPANAKLFKAAVGTFNTAKVKYTKILQETIDSKPTIKDKNGFKLPTPMKEAFPDTYRQLKVLKTEVDALGGRLDNALAAALTANKADKINDDKNAAKGKLKDPEGEVKAAKVDGIMEEAALKLFVMRFSTTFKSGMTKGLAVIQRIKAAPTLVVYNKEMNNGGRDISQNLNNIVKLKANPAFAKSSLAKKLPDPGPLSAAITPFADGKKRNLPNNATPQDVKVALEEFTALVKRIQTTYAAFLAG